jgi:hypothetical protein
VSEWRDEEGYEAGKDDLGLPLEAAGCFLEGCFTFVLPSVLIVLFVWLR